MDMDVIEGSVEQILRYTDHKNGHTAKILRLNQKLERVLNQADHINNQIHEEDAKLATTLTKIDEETHALDVQLQLNGYDVTSLKSLKILVRIWGLGLGGFDVSILPALDPREKEQMQRRFGETLSFDLWSQDCVYISNEDLQELKELLESALAANVDIVERQALIMLGINTIVAEFRRRDVVSEREKENRASARQENWVARSAED